jgi:predicted dehydrogenase
MADTIHYGIIGCGMMGQEHLRNIALLPDTRISVIYEPDTDMANRSRQFAPHARFTDSIDALLQHEPLDCLVIASPNFRHMEQLDLLQGYNLPVLVEKPLFTDPQHIARIDQFSSAYNAPVWVAMEYRYMPPVASLLQQVEDATGGIKMLTIREHRFPFLEKVGDWNRFNHQTGGTFVEKCCHFFDLMRHTIRSEPLRVMASGAQDINHLDESYPGGTPDIFDNGYVIVDFENGARAMLELCMFAEGSRWQEEISAVGVRGRIETRVPGPSRFWDHSAGPEPVPEVVVSPRSPVGPVVTQVPVDPELLQAGDHHGSTFYQHQKFLQVVRGEQTDVEVSLNDGKMAVLMGMAAQTSMIENRMVSLSEYL